jgi:hypothetical protein
MNYLKFIKNFSNFAHLWLKAFYNLMTNMTTFFRIVFLSLFILSSSLLLAQPASTGKDDGAKPKNAKETKLTEVITSVGDTVLATEMLKRAVNWAKLENAKYVKSGANTTGSKVECDVSFVTKPKDLNPETDYTGKITMKVSIECKDNRYKYTVYDIRHISKSGNTTAGSIDNVVPECGSMMLGEITWKKLRGEALRNANMIVSEIKVAMEKPSDQVETEEW